MQDLEKSIKQLMKTELPGFTQKQVNSTLELLAEGNTVPFIARYRKELTGALDEVQIREIESTHTRIKNLQTRKKEVIQSISNQDKLTKELEKQILEADQLQRVEDLYLPYKRKRRTKATVAREQGLEPLAAWLNDFPEGDEATLQAKAEEFIDEEKEVNSAEAALAGAHEIIAEDIGDNAEYRARVRQITNHLGSLSSHVKNEEADELGVYEMYYDYSQKLKDVQNHRVLALNRGEKEGVLTVNVKWDDAQVLTYLLNKELPKGSQSQAIPYVQTAIEDGYRRFIKPSIEREIRSELTAQAEEQAINVFGENLGHLLLQAPLKDQTILGLDPAYRTGCKLAVIDETGKLLEIGVIYPHKPASRDAREAAGPQLKEMIEQHNVDIVAIGNGTASRESEHFVAELLKEIDRPVSFTIVNEAGASVYSASEEARREFPDLEVEQRSAVSIARRLQDPLAELVKIDPKSLGVGQYQHDVTQKDLTEQLDFVIETAVNRVGVNVNTASAALLEHIAGLNKTTAQNIVTFREEQGIFTNRKQLKDVPRVGPKAYEQSVGFLRIPEGEQPFDNTGIHPETYKAATKILEVAEVDATKLGTEETKDALYSLDKGKLREVTDLGNETLADILEGLSQPGRDMRDEMDAPILQTDVMSLKDLKPGMEMQGTVRNVVDFGAFVDIGVSVDGLVHISKISKDFVKHPSEKLAVGDIVTTYVEDVDVNRERISLTMLKG